MPEHGIRPAGEDALGAGKVSVAEAGGVDLDEDFVRLNGVKVDLAQLEFAIYIGHDEGCCATGHFGGPRCGVWGR